MLLLIFTFFSFLSAFLLWKKKAKLGGLSFFLALFLFLGVGQGWAARVLLASLQGVPPLLRPVWQDRNAIVLLGGGSVRWQGLDHLSTTSFAYSRLFEAARLYRDCRISTKICIIVASGGDPRKNGVSEAQLMQRELIQIGIPVGDILIEEQSRNTFENAKFTEALLKSHNFSKHVLVTSGFHLWRATTFFSHFNLQVEGAPSDRLEAILYPVPLSQNFLFADIALREYIAFAQFRFYELMGWNKTL